MLKNTIKEYKILLTLITDQKSICIVKSNYNIKITNYNIQVYLNPLLEFYGHDYKMEARKRVKVTICGG